MKKVTSILVSAVVLIATTCGLSSCDFLVNQDPVGTVNFNKTLVKGYMLARAADRKQPTLIEDVSNTQKITLHGESLLTAVCSVKGEGLAQHQLIYFVSRNDDDSYLSGGNDLLAEIDHDGYQVVSDRIFFIQLRLGNQAVNEYFQKLDAFFLEMKTAVSEDDVDKMQSVKSSIQNLEAEALELVKTLSPSQKKQCAKYITNKMNEIAQVEQQKAISHETPALPKVLTPRVPTTHSVAPSDTGHFVDGVWSQ